MANNPQLKAKANPSTPPRGLQVNRGTCRFGRYKNPRRPHPPPRASRVSCHPPQVSGLTFAQPLAHPTSLALTHRRPLDHSSHTTRVHFGPLASAAKMGSYDGVVPWLHCTRRQVGSKYNSELGSPTSRLIFSFLNLSLSAVDRGRSSPYLILLEPSASFPAFSHPGAVPVILSLLPLRLRLSSLFSRADGSKTHRRGVQSNYGGEWLGTRGL
jgi:hypothetical protein